MSNKLYQFRKEKHLTDFVVEIISPQIMEEYHTHFIILCTRSSYFEKISKSNMKEMIERKITMNVENGYVLVDYLNGLYDLETNIGDLPSWQHLLEMIMLKNYLGETTVDEMKKLYDINIPEEGLDLLSRVAEITNHPLMTVIAKKHNIPHTFSNNVYLILGYDNYVVQIYLRIEKGEYMLLREYYDAIIEHSANKYVYIRIFKDTIQKINLHNFEEDTLVYNLRDIGAFAVASGIKKYIVSCEKSVFLSDGNSTTIDEIKCYSHVSNVHLSDNNKYLAVTSWSHIYITKIKSFKWISKHPDDYYQIFNVSSDGVAFYFHGTDIIKNNFGNTETIYQSQTRNSPGYYVIYSYTFDKKYLVFLENPTKIIILDENFHKIREHQSEKYSGIITMSAFPDNNQKLLVISDIGAFSLNIFAGEFQKILDKDKEVHGDLSDAMMVCC